MVGVPAAAQFLQAEVDQLALKANIERAIDHRLALEAVAAADLIHEIDGVLLQHPGTHAALDVFAAARFEHHAIDARPLQEMRQKKAGGPLR